MNLAKTLLPRQGEEENFCQISDLGGLYVGSDTRTRGREIMYLMIRMRKGRRRGKRISPEFSGGY